MLMYFQLVK